MSLPSLAAKPATPAPIAALPKTPEATATAAKPAGTPVQSAAAPEPLPDFVPASGTISSGIVPEAPARKLPAEPAATPAPLPAAPGE